MNVAVVDLGFGDAGKGSITDFLVRQRSATVVVRFNGGAQAGHNVVAPDGRHHCFAQFGSGSFVPGVQTWLGPEFLLHPLGMEIEARHLIELGVTDIWERTFVDRRARLITPYQQAMNRWREAQRGSSAHGSCGVGIGECVADSLQHDDTLRAGDLGDPRRLLRLLRRQRDRKVAELEQQGPVPPVFTDPDLLERVLDVWKDLSGRIAVVEPLDGRIPSNGVVFEGAQGVLLDEWWGFHPHTTWSDCTFGNVEALTDTEFERLGVLRTYGVRHGPGPFPGEGLVALEEAHNQTGVWQGPVRTGALDLVLLRYALEACPVDSVALTCLDLLESGPVVERYRGLGRLDLGERTDLQHRELLTQALLDAIPEVTHRRIRAAVEEQVPLSILSSGPRAADKVVVGQSGEVKH